ncbi:capsule assembly Wzi family protein [Pleomorphovibrio marinus]|uniref:capsule assembly Wzi family protein n=1 Tax=Pleomorphovibrio marinus TaxID=2164132 RepID=UPI000E0BB319|nr:capsule assembly Wzi family protein [Pleomorphovibrio marinus]
MKYLFHPKYLCCALFLLIFFGEESKAQVIVAGQPVLEEALRRKQILGELEGESSFALRPIKISWSGKETFPLSWEAFYSEDSDTLKNTGNLRLLPFRGIGKYAGGRPSGPSPYEMLPAAGLQTLGSVGVEYMLPWLHVYLQPTLLLALNPSYQGYPGFGAGPDANRFSIWRTGDMSERLYPGRVARLGWGNSKAAIRAGAWEMGMSTENIWWGPGQFHSLTFSHHAPGFAHFTINTHRPMKTFLGNIEAQLVMGSLQPNTMPYSQNGDLNDRHSRPRPDENRYLNAVNIVFSPKWPEGLHLGLARTFQRYVSERGTGIRDWLPVLEPFQKVRHFNDGHSVDYDRRRQDQQASAYARYLIPEARMELYFEFGRRDHAFNWREFFLNPEHARAYLIGFKKLFPTAKPGEWLQVRGEMVQGSQSINRQTRYGDLSSIFSWHSHGAVYGFQQQGQTMGIGAGNGTNLQILEFAWVKGLDKLGLMLERAEQHMGFYERAFPDPLLYRPWVDLSMGFQYTKQWDRFLVDAQLRGIQGLNYQWMGNQDPVPGFPRSINKFSMMGQLQVMYLLH